VAVGGIVHIEPGPALHAANHGDDELVVCAHGYSPEREHPEILEPAVEGAGRDRAEAATGTFEPA